MKNSTSTNNTKTNKKATNCNCTKGNTAKNCGSNCGTNSKTATKNGKCSCEEDDPANYDPFGSYTGYPDAFEEFAVPTQDVDDL